MPKRITVSDLREYTVSGTEFLIDAYINNVLDYCFTSD